MANANQNVHRIGPYLFGLKVPNVGMLIAEEPNQVLDNKHQTKLPGNCRVEFNLAVLQCVYSKYGTTGFNYFCVF